MTSTQQTAVSYVYAISVIQGEQIKIQSTLK